METGPAIDGELRDLCFGCNNTPSLRALVWCRSEFCALVGFRVGHCVALNSQVAPSGAAHLCLSPRLCATRGKVTASVALVLVSPFAVRVASIPRRIGAVGCPEPCAALIFGRERMGRGDFPFSLLFSTSSFACPLTVAMHEAPGFLAPSLVVFFLLQNSSPRFTQCIGISFSQCECSCAQGGGLLAGLQAILLWLLFALSATRPEVSALQTRYVHFLPPVRVVV